MFESTKELEKYKTLVKEKLERLNEIFSLAAIGNFSKNIEVPDENDEFSELYAGIQVMLDVIREKIAEVETEKASLEVERNQLKTLVSNLPLGVVIADVNSGKPIMVNNKVEEILGKKPDLDIGWKDYLEDLKILDSEENKYQVEEMPLVTTLSKKIPVVKDDIVLIKSDGTETFLQIQSVPVLNERGQMYSAISVIRDVSREKELEKMKYDFISLASHQLRTPLGSMRWISEMLLKGQYGPINHDVAEVISRMHASVIKMVRLVSELLSVFRIDDGRALDVTSEVDFEKLINDVINEVKPLADEKMLEINFEAQKDLPKVEIDAEKLKEVVQNLISNAIKYNKDKGRVNVKLEINDQHYLLSVSDTGMGISEIDGEKIFEKFYRTVEASRREIEGTGLGLYLVKAYLNRWGGDISFESQEGKGSTFIAVLPIKPKLTVLEK